MRLREELASDALWAALDALAERTGRSVEGYAHVHGLFAHLHAGDAERHHLSPAVLIDGFRDFTRSKLGGQALVFLDLWGITCAEDLGTLALDLVDARIVEVHPSDRRHDFAAGFDFEAAFPLAAPEDGRPGLAPDPAELALGDVARALDGRFTLGGIDLVLQALRPALERAGGAHVSATELLDAFRELCLARFGHEALTTLHGWGIRQTKDVGMIVFALASRSILAISPDDRLDDFADGFDFAQAFPRG